LHKISGKTLVMGPFMVEAMNYLAENGAGNMTGDLKNSQNQKHKKLFHEIVFSISLQKPGAQKPNSGVFFVILCLHREGHGYRLASCLANPKSH
jgi:hypothetical protein